MVLAVPLPMISISPAPPEEALVEPFSPFQQCSVQIDDEDSFRPKHLTPPPSHSKFNSFTPTLPSPLRGSTDDAGKGLERDRFEALLKATRERNAPVMRKGNNDLRKEIALKAHKNKQAERRALFLSKIMAPPSPTATLLPKTPPESPAIFHYSLPSPGLVSPLALFESLNDASTGPLTYARQPWVEQVDYHRPSQPKNQQINGVKAGSRRSKSLPSLDQISERLAAGHKRTPSSESNRPSRLPSFLNKPRTQEVAEPVSGDGARLRVPIRSPQPTRAEQSMIPKSPTSPIPEIKITTTFVPRSSSTSPKNLTESNVEALGMRESKAKNMLCTIKRRMPTAAAVSAILDNEIAQAEAEERKWRRHSAPAEMAVRARTGFEHPVLKLPGGF